jgi:hypothetical protein
MTVTAHLRLVAVPLEHLYAAAQDDALAQELKLLVVKINALEHARYVHHLLVADNSQKSVFLPCKAY